MSELPVGTVTSLFIDIEGSTQLLKQLAGDRYGEVLADHQLGPVESRSATEPSG